ncbi:MAG: hypothetical protein WB952_21040 [Terriglobales bacterium]
MVRKTATLACTFLTICCMTLPAFSQEKATIPRIKAKSYHPPSRVSPDAFSRIVSNELNSEGQASTPATNPLPLTHWSYSVSSSRDGLTYSGVIVGKKALSKSSTSASIPTEIIPVIVKTVSLGTAVDSFGNITTEKGKSGDKTTFDPTAADNSCMASPNNIPATVFKQSPLFQNADFNYGGTDVGTTQATDALQRASFWTRIDPTQYHVLLGSLKVLPAVTLSVPAPKNGVGGLALDLPGLIGFCGRIGLVDVDTIDNFVLSALATLEGNGVTTKSLPLFMFYNTAFTAGDPTSLADCCYLGYHSAVNVGTAASPVYQTYSPFDFDMTAFFINDDNSSVLDTEVASHEVAEWMNDPLGGNPTPAWGNVGQDVGICQDNLEVGDPLSGLEAPRIAMSNHFTYHLQELAFFSWFYGAIDGGPASIGLNGWFSNNASFLTDAGPVCGTKQ